MNFLTNTDSSSNHLVAVTKKLKSFKEAYFATAFLKISGLNLLLNSIKELLKLGGRITIIAGQNFALTEPDALLELRELFKSYPTSKIYLSKAASKSIVFHPKLYLFNSKNSCCVISGSANITQGGLISNKETSIVAECKSNENLWIDAKEYFMI